MKALTIQQPWATLIAEGRKYVENRTWETPYRGPLAIHAAKTSRYISPSELRQYPCGCIVAVTTLWAIRHPTEVPTGKGQEEYTEGPCCWLLATTIPIRPIAATGRQGLWEVDDATQAQIEAAVERACIEAESNPPGQLLPNPW